MVTLRLREQPVPVTGGMTRPGEDLEHLADRLGAQERLHQYRAQAFPADAAFGSVALLDGDVVAGEPAVQPA